MLTEIFFLGGVAAFVIGYLVSSTMASGTNLTDNFQIMSVPFRGFGVSLIVFYLAGSKVTKIGKHLKGDLEEGHDENGYRSGWQVSARLPEVGYGLTPCLINRS